MGNIVHPFNGWSWLLQLDATLWWWVNLSDNRAFIVLIVNSNSLQLLIVGQLKLASVRSTIVQCNCMKLSQLPIGPLLSCVHKLELTR